MKKTVRYYTKPGQRLTATDHRIVITRTTTKGLIIWAMLAALVTGGGFLLMMMVEPVVQSIYHPAPGYYISTTALVNPRFPPDHPDAYVDSERYPFNVVPGSFGLGWKLGDVGFCYNTHNENNMYCATADIGPSSHLGEISMLLAKLLGLSPDPKKGGTESGIIYVVFPGSDPIYRSWDQKCALAIEAFDKWGGLSKLMKVEAQL